MAPLLQSQGTAVSGVQVQVLSVSRRTAQIHWKVTNSSTQTVFIYATFLYGPAFGTKKMPDRIIFATTPTAESPECPNEFPGLRLKSLASGSSIEGIFKDLQLKHVEANSISFLIGVGSDSESVIEGVKQARLGNICENPYNAIVRWQTVVGSDQVQLPSAALPHFLTPPGSSESTLLHESGHADPPTQH